MEYNTLIFYKYTIISDPKTLIKEIYDYCGKLGLSGRILISKEGVNGTVSGMREQCDKFIEKLRSYVFFIDLEFRSSKSSQHTFKQLKVKYRKQLLQFGTPQKLIPSENSGVHLDPQAFHQMKDEVNTVILDVRNNIEHMVGKFKNAITLDLEHFRDFPAKINDIKKHQNKNILTYCTAGIRCEVATAFLMQNGFNKVYQLEGGILNYSLVMGGKDFVGKCYVFDERQTVDVNKINPEEMATCKICEKTTTNIINCADPTCNNLTCICVECAEKYNGCCSAKCAENPHKRIYSRSGYLEKKQIAMK